MTVVTWIIRLLVVLLLTAFAIRNADLVTLRTFLGYEWQAPLVLVLLAFFVGGVIIGLLSLLSTVFRLKREINQLKRVNQNELAVQAPPASAPAPLPPPM
ncbi:MAG: LapA family protein [Burkholderiales bacterium]|nr:LapA family protein [Burkholderiales bacterium]